MPFAAKNVNCLYSIYYRALQTLTHTMITSCKYKKFSLQNYFNKKNNYKERIVNKLLNNITINCKKNYNLREIFGNTSSFQVAKVPSRIFLRAVVTKSR